MYYVFSYSAIQLQDFNKITYLLTYGRTESVKKVHGGITHQQLAVKLYVVSRIVIYGTLRCSFY